jgi:hypothetical protein
MESDIFARGSVLAIFIYRAHPFRYTPADPVRIPYDMIHTHRELALLRREPTSQEKELIPERHYPRY